MLEKLLVVIFDFQILTFGMEIYDEWSPGLASLD